jgi:hypothetical protein
MPLVHAAVFFEVSKGEDRKLDTKLSVVVTKADGTVIATNDDIAPGLTFNAFGTYGPFDLKIVDANTTPDQFVFGRTEMTSNPTGANRWNTNVVIRLTWTTTKRASQSYTSCFLGDSRKSWSNLPFRDDLKIRVHRCPPKEGKRNPEDGDDEHIPPGEKIELCPRGNPERLKPYGLEPGQYELDGLKTPCWHLAQGFSTIYERVTRVISRPLPDPSLVSIDVVRLIVWDFYQPDFPWKANLNQDLAWAAYRAVSNEFADFNGVAASVVAGYFQNWSHDTDRFASINVVYHYL